MFLPFGAAKPDQCTNLLVPLAVMHPCGVLVVENRRDLDGDWSRRGHRRRIVSQRRCGGSGPAMDPAEHLLAQGQALKLPPKPAPRNAEA